MLINRASPKCNCWEDAVLPRDSSVIAIQTSLIILLTIILKKVGGIRILKIIVSTSQKFKTKLLNIHNAYTRKVKIIIVFINWTAYSSLITLVLVPY